MTHVACSVRRTEHMDNPDCYSSTAVEVLCYLCGIGRLRVGRTINISVK